MGEHDQSATVGGAREQDPTTLGTPAEPVVPPAWPAGAPWPAGPAVPPHQPHPALPSYPYARPTSTMAVLALVFGLTGLSALPLIGSVLGVVFGQRARREIAVSGEQGEGLATAGIVTGWVGVAIWGAVLAMFVVVPIIVAIALVVAASTGALLGS